MTRYVLSPRAQADVAEIWNYSAKRWSVEQAENYLRQIKTAIEAVATQPTIGQSCDDIRAGYRRYLTGSHVLFYRPLRDGVDIVRILHTRMDLRRHL
jgi:toxin ParE1/3/4